MKSKIFITGSSGFIGFHVAKNLLDKGFKIHGLDSMNNYYDVEIKKDRLAILKKYRNFSFTQNLLQNEKNIDKIVSKFKPSVIIHLAAQAGVRYSIENPDEYLKSNIIGTFNILNISRKNNIKHLIIGSSSSVYGANKKSPFKETHKTDHQVSFYAATNKSTESIAHSYSSLWKLPVTMLRFFTVYGPWGRPDMAYWSFTKNILEQTPIKMFNHGNLERDFTYIDDVVYGIAASLNVLSQRPLILNLGSHRPVNLKRFIEIIETSAGQKAIIESVKMQSGDVPRTYANISRSRQVLGYNPTTSLEDGISRFVTWYQRIKLERFS